MQVAKYILWSLVLSVFHAASCALLMQQWISPRTIWLRMQRLWRRRRATNSIGRNTRGVEHVQVPTQNIECASPAAAGEDQHDAKEEVTVVCDVWEAVPFGLNCLITAVYLLGNAIVFVLYMWPLLYRITSHSEATSYLVPVSDASD